jgi:hypothetical protein
LHFGSADCIAHRFTDALTDAPPDQLADDVTDFPSRGLDISDCGHW